MSLWNVTRLANIPLKGSNYHRNHPPNLDMISNPKSQASLVQSSRLIPGRRITSHLSPITYYLLPIPYHLLPATYHL